ncbi:MAG: hypothetical protein RL701_5138 [Pseudomonadota bacterium]
MVDRYRLHELLGRGGMACVYRATDLTNGREVALKQLISDRSASTHAGMAALFEREFHTLAQLSHPHVIAVYDYGLDADARLYYTMELLDGGDLRDCAPLPWREVCRLLFDVCSSLALLHSRRLLHRDISPRNIRRTRDGRAKLIDFGAMAPMTAGGASVVGTPAFIAPETLHRLALDARSDLYSLGATLYHALTGQVPYPAASFAEVLAAWRYKVVPPSALVADIPAALDDLVLALINLEPDLRPQSPFDVMQRLAACAGLVHAESDAVSRAYLATPALVGREEALDRFRDRLLGSRLVRGGAMLIEGRAGVGRSRMLDACALEAKTLGFRVMRASATGTREPFATASSLTQHLLEELPSHELHAAPSELFVQASSETESVLPGRPTLRDFADPKLDAAQLQQAICKFWANVGRTQPLLIAVDDVHRIEPTSAAVLAALIDAARQQGRVFVLLSADSDEPHNEALAALSRRCTALPIAALTREQTLRLLGSLFGDVANLELLTREFYEISAGSPRQCMTMAQHLVDRGLVRYAAGTWVLPNRLSVNDLPRSAEAALRARIQNMSSEARCLAETQALAFYETLTDQDYRALLPEASSQRVEQVLLELLSVQAVVSDGAVYLLANRLWVAALSGGIDPEQAKQRHSRLAAMYAGKSPIAFIHHSFAAGEHERGLEALIQMNTAFASSSELNRALDQNVSKMMWCYEPALETARRIGLSRRKYNDLLRWNYAGSVSTDDLDASLAGRAWLAQLEHDTGLDLHRKSSLGRDPGAQLTAALQGAYERFLATPEHERVYPVDEAIRLLAEYVVVSIAIGASRQDSELLRSLPTIIEPFEPLAPMLNAIGANARATFCASVEVNLERGRELWLNALDTLATVGGAELLLAEAIANAIRFGIGITEALLGLPSAISWADQLEKDPSHKISALQLRRIVRLEQGDWKGAERYRREAEVVGLQARAPQMFKTLLLPELDVCAKAGDLTGIQEVLVRMQPMAARFPGWAPSLLNGEARFHLVRGDAATAKLKCQESIERSGLDANGEPSNLAMWYDIHACLAEALLELGEAEQARATAQRALDFHERQTHGRPYVELVRVLALAEAKLGVPSAAERLETSIAQQTALCVAGLRLGMAYEARARIALWAEDADAFARYADLTAREYRHGAGSALGARYERLMQEAERHGQTARAGLAAFETTRAFDTSGDVMNTVARGMAGTRRLQERAHAALQLLCDSRHASAGHLYLQSPSGLSLSASFGAASAEPPREAVQAFLQRAQSHDAVMDDMETGALLDDAAVATHVAVGKGRCELLLLACVIDNVQHVAGVAAVAASDAAVDPLRSLHLLPSLAKHLLLAGEHTGTSA